MLFWNRFGFVALVFLFGFLIFAEWISEAITKDSNFYQHHRWVGGLAFLAAGVACYLFDKYVAPPKEKVVVDAKTGETLVYVNGNSLSLIPLRYYLIVWPLFGTMYMWADMKIA